MWDQIAKVNDFTGQQIGRLTVIQRSNDIIESNGRRRTAWLCRCECGKPVVVRGECLSNTKRQTRSCGCLSADIARQSKLTHGHTDTKLYGVWCGIKARCYNANSAAYERYGGRNIQMCNEWRNSYIDFETWAIGNGYTDGLSIDRIDVNGNYEPSNCRWVNATAQANNRRTNRILNFNGEEHTLTEWAQMLNVSPKTLFSRLYAGHSVEEILSTNNSK